MSLVTDTWGANRNPTPKPFKMYKTLSATAASGVPGTATGAFFTKDCPFAVKVLGFEVQAISVSGGGFVGSGSNLTVTLQSSVTVDASPAAPISPAWLNVVSVDTSGVTASTDKMLLNAPANSGSVVNASLDQSNVAVPKGGSLRATLSATSADAVASTPVELLAIVECVPTETKDQLNF